MLVVALGIVIGLGAAFALTRAIAAALFGISTADPLTYIAVPLILGFVALVALRGSLPLEDSSAQWSRFLVRRF